LKPGTPQSAQQVTHRKILRVLLIGFTLVVLLLLTAAIVGVRNIRSIQRNAATLVDEQKETAGLIAEIQWEQEALNAVFYNLARHPEPIDRNKILSQLDKTEQNIARLEKETDWGSHEKLWLEFRQPATEFSTEARRLLALERTPTLLSRDLFRRHQQVIGIMSKLVSSNYAAAQDAQQEIDSQSRQLATQSFVLLGGCLLLALLFAVLTVRITAALFRKMEWQASELSRVSWHMFQNQETTARRFSHELHDELGQSLTALKANLASLKRPDAPDKRLDDSISVVDEAIRNVREMSHLLHPTILDDFGLDAGLRWLAERFNERTGIEVDYASDAPRRLPEETERHLFRIAQEALTNVARHSGASCVRLEFRNAGGAARLSIQDDGQGLPVVANVGGEGLGMIGMRARARSAGGELNLYSQPGQGVKVEVSVPVLDKAHAEEDPHPARR